MPNTAGVGVSLPRLPWTPRLRRSLRLLPRPFQSLYLTRNPRPRLRRNRSRNLSPSQNLRLRRSLYLNRRIRLFPTCRIASA